MPLVPALRSLRPIPSGYANFAGTTNGSAPLARVLLEGLRIRKRMTRACASSGAGSRGAAVNGLFAGIGFLSQKRYIYPPKYVIVRRRQI